MFHPFYSKHFKIYLQAICTKSMDEWGTFSTAIDFDCSIGSNGTLLIPAIVFFVSSTISFRGSAIGLSVFLGSVLYIIFREYLLGLVFLIFS